MFETMIIELKLSNVSKNTIDAYVYQNTKFIEFINKKPHQITSADIKKYLIELQIKNVKPRTTRLVISALNYYYAKIMRRNIMKSIRRPKLPKELPKILEKEEVKQMMDVTNNPKHKLLIALLYSSGMRVGEAIKLKKEDIRGRYAFVNCGKGKKDRYTILSDKFLELYKDFDKGNGEFLFEGRTNHICRRTAEEIISGAAKKAGIKIRVYPHMLRASFATHLMDDKVELEAISDLLGHSDINITKNIYVKARSNRFEDIQSPLDT